MPAAETFSLLQAAKSLDLKVLGISFHVCPSDSGCQMFGIYAKAIALARIVFDEAISLGMSLKILDIGGGYPGSENGKATFAEIAREISESLDVHFPTSQGIRIIAEPGRYFVTQSQSVACNIISKKIVKKKNTSLMMYYINDGNYGSFLDGIIIKRKYYPKVLCCKTTSDSKEKFRDTSQYVSSSWEKKSSMGIYFGLKQFYTEIYFLDTNSFPIGWILNCFPGV